MALNRSTDVEIPDSAWSGWIETGVPRKLRRPLRPEERAAIEARRDELLPVLAPVDGRHETDVAKLAIADMFASFRSMRQTGEEAMGILEATFRAVHGFPLWAIAKVCLSIQMNGVYRGEKYDRQWPPNDGEIIAALREEIRQYERNLRSASALLTAEVGP
jgi:hypothetical protein